MSKFKIGDRVSLHGEVIGVDYDRDSVNVVHDAFKCGSTWFYNKDVKKLRPKRKRVSWITRVSKRYNMESDEHVLAWVPSEMEALKNVPFGKQVRVTVELLEE